MREETSVAIGRRSPVDFTTGLLALAVGIAFDMQRLFPKFGDRVTALCALTVGAAWLSGGEIGGWFADGTDTVTTLAGTAANDAVTDIPTSAGEQVLGIVIGIAFLMWFLAVIPAMGFVTKHLAGGASNGLVSALTWSGALFPPLIGLVPGRWGEFATDVTFMGVRFGETISGWALG
jgi:hypothetical protein